MKTGTLLELPITDGMKLEDRRYFGISDEAHQENLRILAKRRNCPHPPGNRIVRPVPCPCGPYSCQCIGTEYHDDCTDCGKTMRYRVDNGEWVGEDRLDF